MTTLWRSAGREARRRRGSGGATRRALVGRLRRPKRAWRPALQRSTTGAVALGAARR